MLTDDQIRELLKLDDGRGAMAPLHTRMAFERACPELAREVLRLRAVVGAYVAWCEGDGEDEAHWYDRFRSALAGREWNNPEAAEPQGGEEDVV